MPGRDLRGLQHQVATLETEDGWQVSALVPWRPTAAVDEWSRVEILDVRTGHSLAPEVASLGVWAHRPHVCGPDADRFCITGVLEPETDTENDRVDEYSVTDQAFRAPNETDAGFFEGGTAFSSRVSYTDQGVLRYGENGDLLWERSYADVFGEGTAPSGGWHWSDPSADDAPLLALGFEATPDVDWAVSQEIVRDLTTCPTARCRRRVNTDPVASDES
ncbi:hypothetical protein [Microbacterium esteraromaticum]|uniref:hypothetical protein n=1 Tax=Microbacterium esteraromaticum TaxID=57043 RepID=UPI001C94E18C|nr:hypothetical protein [Microbacterium esteraromaticum]MBY6062294.1 hypothetical protein [Microbacterium esteraromaticum]